jgi:hypothetical protein
MSSRVADIPRTAQEHFKLHFFGAILQLRERLREFRPGEGETARLAFLGGYFAELDRVGQTGKGPEALAAWGRDREAWERHATGHLPIRALRDAAGLDDRALALLFAIGLVEEDPRFALLFDVLQGGAGHQRPTVGLLVGWWEDASPGDMRAALRQLLDLGVCGLGDGDSLRPECALQVAPLVWDLLRGDAVEDVGDGVRHHARATLAPAEALVVPPEVRASLRALPPLLEDGSVSTVVVRGPRAGGRRTVLGALAASAGRGVLAVPRLDRRAGVLATLLHAVPLLVLELGPAETAELSRPAGLDGPLGIVLGRQGGIGGSAMDGAITLTLGLPDADARRRHWEATLGHGADVELLADRFRMTGGNIRRVARLARAAVALDGGRRVEPADVRHAGRALGRETLDTLAAALPPAGDWSRLATDERTRDELALLELRCRHRERLRTEGAGVRALFTGPSGTGKTLAARVLASMLEIDLYRLDLSTVVNKYIGETEKNLSRVFERAEELDVALLLDEGDSLLTQRTDVQTAHDRYANLETNYLLQRLETFEGILIVTTNAGDRIDGAFQRRMDVVIDFRAPDVAERWEIWHLHLPPGHTVAGELLEQVALRCALTGGQIRNAVVHATLLGLAADGLGSSELEAAVRREYRKIGGVCPLAGEWAHAG